MNKLSFIIALTAFARIAAAEDLPHPIDPHEMINNAADARERAQSANAAGSAAINNSVSRPAQAALWGITNVTSFIEWRDAYHALTSLDATCMDLTLAGASAVPSSCAENVAACGQCYTSAYAELDEARLKLEKLRCIYTATKSMADKAIAFGDSASGVHAVTGLAWQEQKRAINKSLDELNKSYDGKYGEFIPKLKSALEHVGQCETQFFQERDWYARFGYIYFTFMSDRYKRVEK